MSLLPLQVLLLLVALVAVPWMLIPKPYILKKRHEARQAQVPCSQHQAPAVHMPCACAGYLMCRQSLDAPLIGCTAVHRVHRPHGFNRV